MKVRAGHALSGDRRYNEMLPEEVWMRRSGRNVQGHVEHDSLVGVKFVVIGGQQN